MVFLAEFVLLAGINHSTFFTCRTSEAAGVVTGLFSLLTVQPSSPAWQAGRGRFVSVRQALIAQHDLWVKDRTSSAVAWFREVHE